MTEQYGGLTPQRFPWLFSQHTLGSAISPGVVTFSGHDRVEDWDIQAAKGTAGASSKLNGRPVGSFQATYELTDEADADGITDLDRWDEFQRVIESTVNGPTPIALPIYHPDLARNGFTEVVSGGVGGLIWQGNGLATVQVKYLEFRPPKAKPTAAAGAGKAKTSGATSAAGTASKPDPNADAKRELAELVDEASRP